MNKCEAAEPFRKRITREEKAQIEDIRTDISVCIYWNKLAEQTYKVLFTIVSGGFFGTKKSRAEWLTPSMDKGLLPEEERLLLDKVRGTLRQEYLVLLFIKKLLGKLKQMVVTRLNELQPHTIEEENKFFMEVEDHFGVQDSADTDVMSLIIKALDEEFDASQSSKDSIASCYHQQTQIFYEKRSSRRYKIERCKICKKTLSQILCIDKEYSKSCSEHVHTPVWVEGKEGTEAICTQANCGQLIEDPSLYDWEGAGLEPYADRPEEDEVTTIEKSK